MASSSCHFLLKDSRLYCVFHDKNGSQFFEIFISIFQREGLDYIYGMKQKSYYMNIMDDVFITKQCFNNRNTTRNVQFKPIYGLVSLLVCLNMVALRTMVVQHVCNKSFLVPVYVHTVIYQLMLTVNNVPFSTCTMHNTILCQYYINCLSRVNCSLRSVGLESKPCTSDSNSLSNIQKS